MVIDWDALDQIDPHPLYYDRQGKPMSLKQWALGFPGVADRRVAETTLPDGKWVSTVWLGLDHRYSMDGPPLIFETMVFKSRDNMEEVDVERYSTEAEALAGHRALVKKWTEHPKGDA